MTHSACPRQRSLYLSLSRSFSRTHTHKYTDQKWSTKYVYIRYITLHYVTNCIMRHMRHTATHCNTLQHTATHCNTLQHTATHCVMRHLRHTVSLNTCDILFHTTSVTLCHETCVTQCMYIHTVMRHVWHSVCTYMQSWDMCDTVYVHTYSHQKCVTQCMYIHTVMRHVWHSVCT